MNDNNEVATERRRDIGGYYAGPDESWTAVIAGFFSIVLIGLGLAAIATGAAGLLQALWP